jgi:hypothetical protein
VEFTNKYERFKKKVQKSRLNDSEDEMILEERNDLKQMQRWTVEDEEWVRD